MLAKLTVFLALLVFYMSMAAVIREPSVADREEYPVDCSILSECGGSWECVEFLISLYRLDCFSGPASKRSFGGGKRAGLKNLEKIFLGSYMTRMR